MPEYARRDIIALDEAGGYYHRHVAAMTGEGLHSKRAIAAELGWRDQRIAELQEKLQAEQLEHALWKGVATRDSDTIIVALGDVEERKEIAAGYMQILTAFCRDWVKQAPRFMEVNLRDNQGEMTVTVRKLETPSPVALLLQTEEREKELTKHAEHLKSLLCEALELLTAPRGGMGGGLVVPEFMRRVSEVLRDSKKAQERQQRERLCDELDTALEKLRGSDAD